MDAIPIFASIGTDLANTATQVATEFGLSWPYFIAQVVSFSIVAFCLHRFAYQPILKVLEDRRRTIAESLANADKINDELAKTEAARKEILAQANDQGVKLIEEARAAAAQVQKQETQKAVAAAEQIIAKAREAAAADHARMLAELKREVASLVAQTTAKVTGKILTVEDQRRLAEETNRQIAA
jgi:F-type H+-transporting ATPase subunit b